MVPLLTSSPFPTITPPKVVVVAIPIPVKGPLGPGTPPEPDGPVGPVGPHGGPVGPLIPIGPLGPRKVDELIDMTPLL